MRRVKTRFIYSRHNNNDMIDKIDKLSRLDKLSQLKMIYMWVKQQHITQSEFITLIELYNK
jgi:hypothetical protein